MNSGSLIVARVNLSIFAVLIISLLILVVLGLLWFISKKIENYRNSKEYAEKNKNKLTTQKELNEVSKNAKLTKSEREILISIFKTHPSPNVNFALRDNELFESYLTEVYAKLSQNNETQILTSFFSLRSKIYSTYETTIKIKNSRLIPVETVFTFTPSQGIHHKFELSESNSEEMHFILPSSLQNDEKPEILSKIKMIFLYKESLPFEIETRVIRYQKNKENKDVVVCSQTDRITELKKRSTPRVELNSSCTFSSVKTEIINGKNNYHISEKTHEGILKDSSAGGCRIITKLPIKSEQYIHINAPFDGTETSKALGLILRTTKNKKDEYILHIKFIQITQEQQNRINAVACGYLKIN